MVNFNGAVRGHQAAAGFIIRNHDGAMLLAGGKQLSCATVPYAELIGAWLEIFTLLSLYSS